MEPFLNISLKNIKIFHFATIYKMLLLIFLEKWVFSLKTIIKI